MKIEKVEIKGLFGKKDICWELNPQVNVLVGANGSGKSTILSLLYDMLLTKSLRNNIDLFDSSKIYFSDSSVRIFDSISPNELSQFENNISSDLRVLLQIVSIKSVLSLNEVNSLDNENKLNIKVILGKDTDKLYIDLIEANLTNSNANHIIQKSNQEKTNALDMEIRETIYEFNKIKTDELIERLLSSFNLFFNQIGKQVSYENNELVYTDIDLQKKLNYSHLSSGERQLIYILLRVVLSNADKNKTAIILMDEPEISLHLDWQEHFIKQLTILNPDAQFIIVTHSPALIMNGWNDVYTDMEEITTWL
ncbi:AAA family ATPase [Moraxella sp. ZY210820]|uniref:AAA family ATPase n=1 Tax=unclassified Moraxella TaxID=2685852 RepID=UPI0027318CF7|nr:ATP-binding protein [Moraxella sp. ZY210820]WLF84200.1 AAA family ATPase [Moraxella sp. ZY210820]